MRWVKRLKSLHLECVSRLHFLFRLLVSQKTDPGPSCGPIHTSVEPISLPNLDLFCLFSPSCFNSREAQMTQVCDLGNLKTCERSDLKKKKKKTKTHFAFEIKVASVKVFFSHQKSSLLRLESSQTLCLATPATRSQSSR